MQNRPIPFLANNLTQAGVKHGFFGRKGGVSSGLYESLNCGYGSDDLRANVDENRSRVAGHFGIGRESLIGPHQVRGPDCIYIEQRPEITPKADAFVTRTKALALSVLAADCAPILLFDPKTQTIAAAHAGWQGAIEGVINNTIIKMHDICHCNPSDIIAAIGPCIGKNSYEVGQDFLERFLGETADNELFFSPSKANEDKYYFDLKSYCATKLKQCGISNIDILPNDTFAEDKDFFSNRRRNKAGEADFGRNLSAIMLG